MLYENASIVTLCNILLKVKFLLVFMLSGQVIDLRPGVGFFIESGLWRRSRGGHVSRCGFLRGRYAIKGTTSVQLAQETGKHHTWFHVRRLAMGMAFKSWWV